MTAPHGPVIVVGMHRSGTSLVTRLLEDLGLFVGARHETDHEASFFRRLNDWIFSEAGASWDHPEAMLDLLGDEEATALVLEALRMHLRGPAVIDYIGPINTIRGHRILALSRPWGWKDPRNTFTLPLWTTLFPDSRIVHVVRHGVDVASSLVTREQRLRKRARSVLRSRTRAYALIGRMPRLISSSSCASLEHAFDLWETYVDAATRLARSSSRPTLTVRYEDVLQDPEGNVPELARFCGLAASNDRIADAVRRVESDRAFAYRRDDELRHFARRNLTSLRVWGYGAEPTDAQDTPMSNPSNEEAGR